MSVTVESDRLALPTHSDISRADSFKSERSDKRVSFNKDVGVKHIPRGIKPPAPQPPSKGRKNEWSDCTPVYLEPPPSSSKELERQAEDLVKLLDQVDCVVGANSKNSAQERASRNNTSSLPRKKDRSLNITRRNNLTADRSTSPEAHRRPPIKQSNYSKENINVYRPKRDNKARAIRRSLSAHPANDTTTSDTDYAYEKFHSHYRSVPNLPSKIESVRSRQLKSRSNNNLEDIDPSQSEENPQVEIRYPPRLRKRKSRSEYKSADNLNEAHIPPRRRLPEYKSAENIHSGYSSSDFDMAQPSYRPKVGNIVKRLNYENDSPRTHYIRHDEPVGPRDLQEPTRMTQHNENKPFSYIGASLSSIEEVRRLSPGREIPNTIQDQYTPVNKSHGRISRSTSRDNDRPYRNGDSDYSAKIIITSDPPRRRYDDDDAYETFQVGESAISRQMRELGYSADRLDDDYKFSNNNMNMSSIGVQTESGPRAPYRSKRTVRSERDEYDARRDSENDLSSASLVRRVTHGFGRTERSPSPRRIVGTYSKPTRNVVPLLSDTDDSEFNYRRKVDPMAKIRDQVNIRGTLKEEDDYKDEQFFHPKHKSLHDLRSSGMQPLTVDEVDGLELEVDRHGKNSLVVARESHSQSTSRLQDDTWRSKRPLDNRRSPSVVKDERPKSKPDKPTSKFFSTLERIKKGSADKNKNTLDLKDTKAKDKKKKRIKIKFFYDPRTQDAENEDPLKKFTEYKGTSSDEISAPRYYKGDTVDDYYPETTRRSYSREGTIDKSYNQPDRPPRHTNRDRRSMERDDSINRRGGRESSNERSLPRNSHQSRNTYIPGNYSNRNTLEKKRNNDKYSEDYIEYQDALKNSERRQGIMESYAATRSDVKPMGNRTYRASSYDSDKEKDRRYDAGVVTNSLSNKYRSLARKQSPAREIVLDEVPSKPTINVEDEEKKSKILRQRNKFLGVIRGEGRTKKQAPPPPSVTLSRTEGKPSSTLTRTRDKDVKKEEEAAKIIEKVKEQTHEGRSYVGRDRTADVRETKQWESATLSKTGRSREPTVLKDSHRGLRHSVDSSGSSPRVPSRGIQRKSSVKQRYFGDTDSDRGRVKSSGPGDYRSLPNRRARSNPSRFVMGSRRITRGGSPGARGSAASSLQSSESEADSYGGSHGSQASRASHVSMGSNRSVYLHATAVADIPVRRGSEETPSERGASRQQKRVSRSFSLAAPWKPRHLRDRYEVEYDNREVREANRHRGDRSKSSLPPRPPKKTDNKVGRSQTVYKDSKLAGWLRKRKNKEVTKGI